MNIIGIDPGKTGAVVIIGALRTECHVMPETVQELATLLTKGSYSGHSHVFLEKAQAMPGQGVSSMFTYGVHFGKLLGVLETLVISHTLVPPSTWTKVMHAGTKTADSKTRSLEAARRLFPNVDLVAPRGKKPHLGIVDALLIAAYGCRVMGMKT